MFRTYAESRGLTTPRTFTAAIAEFRKDADSWFDGTVGSVDRRMSRCSKLLHAAEKSAASDPAAQLQVLAELNTDRIALKELRADLLSGAAERITDYRAPGPIKLSATERRWVILESAKFHAEQENSHNVAEMAERARRYAQNVTSASPRSRELIAAFEAAVAGHAKQAPRPRTASRRPVFTDFPDSQMFL